MIKPITDEEIDKMTDGEVFGESKYDSLKYVTVRLGYAIYRHRGKGRGCSPEILLENKWFTVKQYMKWFWYFRYRQSLFQTETPKRTRHW